jgi:hypothetical protein
LARAHLFALATWVDSGELAPAPAAAAAATLALLLLLLLAELLLLLLVLLEEGCRRKLCRRKL